MFTKHCSLILLIFSFLSYGYVLPEKVDIEQLNQAHTKVNKKVITSGYLLVDASYATLYESISGLEALNSKNKIFIKLNQQQINEYRDLTLCYVTVVGKLEYADLGATSFALSNVKKIGRNGYSEVAGVEFCPFRKLYGLD